MSLPQSHPLLSLQIKRSTEACVFGAAQSAGKGAVTVPEGRKEVDQSSPNNNNIAASERGEEAVCRSAAAAAAGARDSCNCISDLRSNAIF